MKDEGSAAYNPEHEDDRVERKVADQPDTKPHRWVNRIVLAIVVIGVAYIVYLMSAAFFPRWWAQRVADQVGGRMSAGVLWGLFYGFTFSFIPVLILFQVRHGLFKWIGKLVVAAIAVVVGVGLGVVVAGASVAMKRRKNQVKRLRGERDELRRSRENPDDAA